MTSDAPISSPVRAILELFEQELTDVRFPDVDQEVLAGVVRDIEEAHELVQSRQAELDAARSDFEDQRKALTKLALRAQQYALVFASDDEALRDRIEAIELEPKPKKVRKPRRKKEKATTQLALAKDVAEEDAA